MGRTKIPGLQRIHIKVDPRSLADLDWLASLTHGDNRSRTVRQLIADEVARQVNRGSKKQARPRAVR